jgi:phosphatidylglycerophosphate synthase
VKPAIPSVITAAGLALSIAALAWRAPLLMVGALACDIADGWVARRLQVCSRFGAEFDWATDACIAAAVAATVSPWALAPLVVWQAVARTREWKTSGRVAVVIVWGALRWGLA